MKYFSFTLKQLKILQTIKNGIDIKIGAKDLYLSESALNLQIKKFEYNIYSKILLKVNKTIYFTAEGELVLDYANKVLKLCKEADKALLYFKKLKRFYLKIGSTKTIAESVSIKLIDLFCKRYSYENLQLIIGCTESISWDIINGKIDVGIIQNYEVPKELYNSLYIKPYVEEKILLIRPKFYEKISLNKESLYKLDFITIKSGFQERKFIDNILKKFNLNLKNLKIKLELNSIGAIKFAVQTGLGVSFLSTLVAKEKLDLKCLELSGINSLKNYNQLMLMLNLKNNESYLSGYFYNYCFAILKPTFYTKFLNLEY